MDEVLHVTRTVNLKNIFEKGLLCFKPSLENHEEYVKKNFSNYHKRGIIYSIPYGCNRINKYLKDTAYWIIWGRPRNDALKISYNDYMKYMNDGPKYFKKINLKTEEHFTVLSIKVPNNIEKLDPLHRQTHNMSNYYTNMDCSFEHKNKPLFIYNENLNYQIKVIGTIETEEKRNKKIKIDLRGC